MKLLSKYSRVHIITAFTILLISSVAYYFIIQSILLKQIDKDLRVEEQEILDFVQANDSCHMPLITSTSKYALKKQIWQVVLERQ